MSTQSAVSRPERYQDPHLEVDFARGELRRGGKLVEITPVEFKLLATFMRSRGRVLSRQQLLDKVWTDTACGLTVTWCRVGRPR